MLGAGDGPERLKRMLKSAKSIDERRQQIRISHDRQSASGNEKWNTEERMPWPADYFAPATDRLRFRSPLSDAGGNTPIRALQTSARKASS